MKYLYLPLASLSLLCVPPTNVCADMVNGIDILSSVYSVNAPWSYTWDKYDTNIMYWVPYCSGSGNYGGSKSDGSPLAVQLTSAGPFPPGLETSPGPGVSGSTSIGRFTFENQTSAWHGGDYWGSDGVHYGLEASVVQPQAQASWTFRPTGDYLQIALHISSEARYLDYAGLSVTFSNITRNTVLLAFSESDTRHTGGIASNGRPPIDVADLFSVSTNDTFELTVRAWANTFDADQAYQIVTAAIAVLPIPPLVADDFDPAIALTQWSFLGPGVLATNYAGYCGVGTGPNSLWFGGLTSRFATTRPLDTTQGGTIGFFVRLADGDQLNWDKPELPQEGVTFEYSVDSGSNWVRLTTYDTPAYTNWFYEFMPIPPGAQAVGTLFRWRQLSFSTDRTSEDNWALDEVEIIRAVSNRAPVLVEQPRSQVVFAATTPSLHAGAKGSWPMTYRWMCNGTNVPSGTNAVLPLLNVAVNQAGAYFAVISNAFGSVTSSIAALTVYPVVPLPVALDTPAWIWTTGGNAPWFGQTNVTHDGMAAARSGPIWFSDMNWLQTVVTGPGTVSFWWKVSSEACCDLVRFFVGGVERTSIAGEVDWQPQSFSIPAGSQVLRWEYSKDDSGTAGQDVAWVDQMSFTPTGLRIGGVTQEANGQVSFSVTGSPGDACRVLASTNLVDWQTLATVTNVAGTAQFVDPGATNYNRRFYQAVMP